MGFFGDVANGIGGALSSINPFGNNGLFADPGSDAEKERKRLLYQQGQAAGNFADSGQSGFNAYGRLGSQSLAGLQQLANGQNSISAEQLRQGLQQNLAAQRSLAAGASPRNSALAARTAAIQSARLGAGLAGQQALAGLQERQQAQQQYAALLQGLRGQNLQATLGSRQNAIGAYGAGNSGQAEKSNLEKYGPAIQAGLSAAALFSDKRLKTDVKDGDGAADKAIAGLKSYMYRYKDENNGKGERLGIMAQDLEKAGLGHAVIDTPRGKAVHGAHLATANTAMISALGRRLAKLEGKAE